MSCVVSLLPVTICLPVRISLYLEKHLLPVIPLHFPFKLPVFEATQWLISEMCYIISEMCYIISEMCYIFPEMHYIFSEMCYIFPEMHYISAETHYISGKTHSISGVN